MPRKGRCGRKSLPPLRRLIPVGICLSPYHLELLTALGDGVKARGFRLVLDRLHGDIPFMASISPAELIQLSRFGDGCPSNGIKRLLKTIPKSDEEST